MFLVRLDLMHCHMRFNSFLPVELALAYRDRDINVPPQVYCGGPRQVLDPPQPELLWWGWRGSRHGSGGLEAWGIGGLHNK